MAMLSVGHPTVSDAQALLPVDGAAPLVPRAPEAQTAMRPGATVPAPPTMAPLSVSQPGVTASHPESQPSAPPPSQPVAPAQGGADDLLAAAGAALPALHTAAGLQGFASPPLQGQEVPVMATAETPTTAMIGTWLVDTPTQPERDSQGELILSLPPPSQQEL